MNLTAPPWLVDVLEHVSVWDAILWIIFLVCVAWFIKKRGWRWMIAFARAILATADVIDHVKDLPDFMRESKASQGAMQKQIAEIHHETHNNDGSSIKDAVDRVELGVKGLHDRIDAVETDVKALQQTDETVRIEIQKTRGQEGS